jgi:O-antigen ligase
VWLASPLAPPLGYSNANAALYVQATALAAIAAVTTAREGLRLFALALTGGLVLLTISTDSLAGLVTGLAVVAALLSTMSGWRPRRRVLTAVLVAAVLAVQVVVLVLGATYRPPSRGQSSVQAAAASSLSERRLALWHDGISLAVEHPLVGVGPQTFPQTSPTARANPDTRETHSAPLQMAAETGWLGGAALLCLLLWAVVRPLLTEPDKGVRAEVVITAAATTGLALHASVDYVLMFPVVVITAALVLGIGTAGSDER